MNSVGWVNTFRNPALYPPELWGRNGTRIQIFLCRRLCYLLPSIAKQGQTAMKCFSQPEKFLQTNQAMRLERSKYRSKSEFLLLTYVFVAIIFGCASGPPPLFIKMHNPETDQTLNCNASDRMGRSDPAVLAAAVESCAQQLEARGFVRER